MIKTMLMLGLSMLLLASCSLFGINESGPQETDKTLASTTVIMPASLDEPFTLQEGHSRRLASINASVTFVSKLTDSRCPLNVDCFWEGEASIQLQFTEDGKAPISIEIKGYVGPEGTDKLGAEMAGYQFMLHRLDPYPVDGEQSEDPVTATLEVRRL